MKRLGMRLGALCVACAPVWAAGDGARDVVERFHRELAEAGQTPDSDARHVLVMSALGGSHDLAALARRSLGSSWDELDEGDRARTVEDFARDCAAYYAAHLADYAALAIAAAEPNANGGASVAATPPGHEGQRGRGVIVYELGRLDSSWLITGVEKDGKDLFGGLHAVARRLESPRSVVQRLQAELLAVMKASDSLGYAGRHARLVPVLEDTHDFASITELSFSRRWRDLDESQRGQAVDHIRRLGATPPTPGASTATTRRPSPSPVRIRSRAERWSPPSWSSPTVPRSSSSTCSAVPAASGRS